MYDKERKERKMIMQIQNEKLVNKIVESYNEYLEERIRTFGLYNTIQYLMDEQFSEEDLKELGFTEKDISLSKNMTDEEREEADLRYVM